MKKFKRIIALVTVAMFLLSFTAPVSAATFSDVKDNKAAAAIYRLNALGIINGYTDGTFKPDNNITRAEFAVIAMSAAGLKNSADILKNSKSKFKDVKPGDWYNGWVNLAASQGYINGYPDGTFKPNNNITYAEAITILVRILGYNENLPGVWPTEYIVKAAELGITDDVNFNGSDKATRGNIAILTSATLDENVVTWDKDKEEFFDKYTPAKTLFADKFDGAKYDKEGLVVTDWGMNSDNQYTITVKSLVYDNPTTETVETNWTGTTTLTLAKDFVINGIGVVPDLVNHMIEYNINTDDDEVTYINVTSKLVKAVDDDVKVDGANLEVNDVDYSYSDAYTAPITKYVAGAPYYKVYLNEDGEIYNVVSVTSGGNPLLVDEYNTNTKKLSFKNGSTIELKDKDVLVIKDGKVAKAEDIKENDVVYVSQNKGSLEYYLDVKTIKDTGKVEAAYVVNASDTKYSEVKISGKKYDLDVAGRVSTDGGDNFDLIDTKADIDDVYGVDVKYFLDKKNDIVFIISDKEAADNTLYGIVTEVTDETLKGEVTKLKVLKTDNTEVEYSVNIDDVVIDWVYDTSPATPSTPDVQLNGSGDWAVKYTLDANGKINDLDLLTFTSGLLTDAVKDSNKIITSSGTFYVDSNTKILNGREAKDASIETNGDLLKYLENASSPVDAWIKTDGNKIKYILLNKDLGASTENRAMIVDKYINPKDGKLWLDVDVRGTKTAYEADSSDTWATVDVDNLYTYSMSGTKIDLGTKVTPAVTTAEVYDKDATNKSIKVNGGAWYEIDAETYIYDLTGDDPVYVKDLDGISIGDKIQYLLVDPAVDADRNGVIDVLYIVD